MVIVALVIATALMVSWFYFLSGVTREDWIAAALTKILDNQEKIDELRRKDAAGEKKLSQYHGVAWQVMKHVINCDHTKEIRELEKQCADLRRGNLKGVNLFSMPGYTIQRMFPTIGKGTVHKKILNKSVELYGKKYAMQKTNRLLAQLLSYPVIGIAAALAFGSLIYVTSAATTGLVVMVVGIGLVAILVYALYDELSDRLNKRRAAISRQFPNVVSKLALLVTSGMIMDRAWRETAESQEMELYQEMRKTSEELSNLMDPVTAYSNFIDRCNTKETTKLASALIQNQSKGNAEIGVLLKNMAHEAWQERRHTAKRDSEAANAKLMIPTMMLLIAILVMIMIPVMMQFTNMM